MTKATPRESTVPGLGNARDGESAVREVEAEANALPIDKVRIPNFDAVEAVFLIGSVKARVEYFRDEIRRRAPDVDITKLDRIDTFALAALHVSSAGRLEPNVEDVADALADAEKLLGDLQAGEVFLVRRGALSERDVADLKAKMGEGHGKSWTVTALEKHIHLWRTNWEAIAPFKLVTKEELDAGAALLPKIALPAVSPEAVITKNNEFRFRVVTLLDNAWEEIRRGIRHIRWYEGDYEAIAPSLRQNASGRRPSSGTDHPKARASNHDERGMTHRRALADSLPIAHAPA